MNIVHRPPGAAVFEARSLAGIALHALEDRQDIIVAPTTIARLRPGIEVLRLAADKHPSVDRAGAAEQFASR